MRKLDALCLAITLAGCDAPQPDDLSSRRSALFSACGPLVRAQGQDLVVRPSGGDDTANLQCALDAAPRGATVRLLAGTYVTRQLVAAGFVGTIAGVGPALTTLRNPDEPMFVTPVDFWVAGAPSAENPWPALISFVGGDVTVRDLTLRVVGEAPTTGWSIFGIDPPIAALAQGVLLTGDLHARFFGVAFEAEPSPGPLGTNLLNGIFFEGFVGPAPRPARGSLVVIGSRFRGVASPTPVVNVEDATILLAGNHVDGAFVGAELSDLRRTRYAYLGNRVVSEIGALAYDTCLSASSACGVESGRLLFAGNRVSSGDGLVIDASFGDDVRCALIGNDLSETGLGVYLGAGTRGCLVLTSPETLVIDEGVDNVIAGR